MTFSVLRQAGCTWRRKELATQQYMLSGEVWSTSGQSRSTAVIAVHRSDFEIAARLCAYIHMLTKRGDRFGLTAAMLCRAICRPGAFVP